MEEVKLLGFWASPFSHRITWALKLKGVNYEYIEEDIFNKSLLLLQYNPVHEKIPVLLHAGKPIAESGVILEYIEETWLDKCPLLPKDPYERAMARFWIKFADDKYMDFYSFFGINERSMEDQEMAVKEAVKVLKVLEEQCLGDKKFFGGNAIGLVDIAYGWLGHWLGGLEEVMGVKLLEPTNFPRLCAWVKNFGDVPVIKENLPNRERMLVYFQELREKSVAEIGGHI
ncbi:probable glutathione S-transferase isoform X2 [Malania oleifera]|nr:probable glutathione S-transferase isoform X2 [Malania oleifera]XP_057959869.1 probable glutathione S-transferase isoform X2 [Malania oleifera]